MPPLANDTFLTGQNAAFIAELYGRFLADPQSVDTSWQKFFAEL
ncbi:MAG: 2-oxoglutarate dehydrogenase E1 subunit family protein, partial [Stellaceae bacterium]